MAVIIGYEVEHRGRTLPEKNYPIVECNCDNHVTCYDSWANECDKCHTEYNGSGQELAPRCFWGEETGEVFRNLKKVQKSP